MIKAVTLAGVHTHTHTDSFREIRKGEKAFINDIKILIKKMTDYKNSLLFLRAKKGWKKVVRTTFFIYYNKNKK